MPSSCTPAGCWKSLKFQLPKMKIPRVLLEIASLAKMQDFSKDQNDLALTISSKYTAPIIVLFYKKKDRNNFLEQKYKVKTLQTNQFSDDAAEEEQHLESNDIEPTQRTYINVSLTKENKELFKLAREEAKKHKYKCKGYTVKGEFELEKMQMKK